MLQTIRDKITGWFAYLFLGAIAVVFVFWGIEMRSTSGTNFAAEVNGERISLETVNRAWQERQQRLQQIMGGEIPEPIRKAQQESVLEEHIRTQLLAGHTQDLGYRVSAAQLRQTITSFPELQVEGKFSRERYGLLLRQQGRSEAQFEKELSVSLRIDQLQNGIVASSFVTPAEWQRRQALEGEQREVDYAVIPMANFLSGVAVSDADIQAYYDANKAEFMTPETIDLEYIDLKLADVEAQVEVSDAALREYYEQVKERLTTPERRLARHILISVEDDAKDAEAKQKAEEVLAKVKAGGDFAALAKQYSQDTVSAAKGGDLDWASRGMFVGPFEDALFAMSPGEVRGPIKTQFGYHIIKLEAKEGGETKSFERAKEELAREYKAEKAQTLFYERSQEMGDQAFNALTELESTAKALGLSLKKANGVTRQGGAPGTQVDPKIVDAAFVPESIEKRHNSSLIQVADDHAAVVRVVEHHAPEQKPLAMVRVEIGAKLKQRAAEAAAAKRGEEILARVQSGAEWSKALAEQKLTAIEKKRIGRKESALPSAVRDAAFAIPKTAVGEKPAYRGVRMDGGDYALVRVSAIQPGTLEVGLPETNAKRQQVAQTLGGEEFGAYLAELQKRADIVRNPRVFE